MSVSKDFEGLFACFNAAGVRYLLVGGYAVAFHAKPRFTKDIDVFIEPTEENARRVIQALAAFGFGDVGLAVEDLSVPDQIVQLGQPPQRIDLLTSIEAVTFEEGWAGRVGGSFGAQQVSYLGKADLIRNQRAVGRLQDQLDLEWLGVAE